MSVGRHNTLTRSAAAERTGPGREGGRGGRGVEVREGGQGRAGQGRAGRRRKKVYSGANARRRRRRKVYSGANAVNEEDPERDRTTQM